MNNVTTTRLSPNRTVVTSFSSPSSSSPQQAADDGQSTPYEDGQWILHVATSSSSSSSSNGSGGGPLSCALSDNTLKTYDTETLHLVHSVDKAHDTGSTITDLRLQNQNWLLSSGTDSHVKIFDLRQSGCSGKAIVDMILPKGEEALSVDLGYGGALMAVGASGKGNVHFYDLRQVGGGAAGSSTLLLGSYVDAHTEDVTRVRFQPPHPNSNDTTTSSSLLVTASEDGLACTHDTSQPSEEMALKSVMNISSSIRDINFFGPNLEGLYCLTGSETLSCWHHDSAQRICDFHNTDIRSNLSSIAGGNMDVEYLVGCHWDALAQELSLLCGNSEGDSALFRVDAGNSMVLLRRLSGGHRSCIRSFAYTGSGGGADCGGGRRRRMLVTGGEDARLCEWDLMSDQNPAVTEQQQQHRHFGKNNGSSSRSKQVEMAMPKGGGGVARRSRSSGRKTMGMAMEEAVPY